MEFFRLKKDIPFMAYGKVTTFISLVTFIVAVAFLVARGLHLSVDFTGGTVMQLHFPQAADVARVRSSVEGLQLGEVMVQSFGNSQDISVRVPAVKGMEPGQVSEKIFAAVKQADPTVIKKGVDTVGPSVGSELVTKGLLAIAFVCIGIIVYLAVRFEWRFAVSAVIANMHDVVIILGCFAAFQWEFSLTALAGVLAVLGYSVNESVVVFDRIRENFRDRRFKDTLVPAVIDNAITSTMSRTIITHLSTQMMVTSMLFFGGAPLHSFALALTIGICFGIYSSVLVASPVALLLGVSREHFIEEVKPDEDGIVV